MSTHRITVDLPAGLYKFLQRLLESGEFESESDVIAEALLNMSLEPVEEVGSVAQKQWLDNEILEACKEFDANPGAVYTSEEVRAYLEGQPLRMQKAG
jgi:Arc/MetJ-type ribon-helix-helix transcriptional regulator